MTSRDSSTDETPCICSGTHFTQKNLRTKFKFHFSAHQSQSTCTDNRTVVLWRDDEFACVRWNNKKHLIYTYLWMWSSLYLCIFVQHHQSRTTFNVCPPLSVHVNRIQFYARKVSSESISIIFLFISFVFSHFDLQHSWCRQSGLRCLHSVLGPWSATGVRCLSSACGSDNHHNLCTAISSSGLCALSLSPPLSRRASITAHGMACAIRYFQFSLHSHSLYVYVRLCIDSFCHRISS